MNRELSKRENILIVIGIVVSIFGAINLILKNIKDDIQSEFINSTETISNDEATDIITNYYEKDIILKIEDEIKNIAKINYINKNTYIDSNNNCNNIIEMQISGRIDNIFYMEDSLKNIGLEDKISKFEIIKNDQILDDEGKIINDYVDCIIQIKGI